MQAKDLSKTNPQKLAELQRLWLIEAVKYNVRAARRPGLRADQTRISPGGRKWSKATTQLLFQGMRVAEACVLTLKNKSHSVTAELQCPAGRRQGRDHHAGRIGRRLDALREGRQAEVLLQLFRHRALLRGGGHQLIPAGKHQVRMEFTYDGGGLAKGGDVTLYYDGKAVGKGRVDKTQPMGYSADEACDVGADSGLPASPDYGPTGNAFNGTLAWVQIDIGNFDDHDHLITAEDRFKIAMARQ